MMKPPLGYQQISQQNGHKPGEGEMTHTQNTEGNVYMRCELRFRQVDKETKAFQKERAVRVKVLRQEKMNYVRGIDNELWQEW